MIDTMTTREDQAQSLQRKYQTLATAMPQISVAARSLLTAMWGYLEFAEPDHVVTIDQCVPLLNARNAAIVERQVTRNDNDTSFEIQYIRYWMMWLSQTTQSVQAQIELELANAGGEMLLHDTWHSTLPLASRSGSLMDDDDLLTK